MDQALQNADERLFREGGLGALWPKPFTFESTTPDKMSSDGGNEEAWREVDDLESGCLGREKLRGREWRWLQGGSRWWLTLGKCVAAELDFIKGKCYNQALRQMLQEERMSWWGVHLKVLVMPNVECIRLGEKCINWTLLVCNCFFSLKVSVPPHIISKISYQPVEIYM